MSAELEKENAELKKEIERLKRRIRELHSQVLGIHSDNVRRARYEMDYVEQPEDEYDR